RPVGVHAAHPGAHVEGRAPGPLHREPAVAAGIALQPRQPPAVSGRRRFDHGAAALQRTVPHAAAFAADAPAAGGRRQRFQAFIQREVDRRMRPRFGLGVQRVQWAIAPDAMLALEADQHLAVFAQGQPLGVARGLIGDRFTVGGRQPPHPQIVQPRQLAVRIQFKPPAHQIAGIRHGDEAAVARQLEIGKAVQAGDGRRDQLHPARIAHALRQPCAAGPAQADLPRRAARGRPAVGRRLGRPGA
ncbi:hypothetical protein LTR94_028066, partial [Friedmanniomyces endolithicus]